MAAFTRTVAAAKADGKALKAKLSRSTEAAHEELDGLLSSLSEKVADVRSALATAYEDGAESVSDGVDTLVKKTRKGVKSLDKRWQKMDRKQKVLVAGGLLAVLAAAAAAPAVVRKARAK
jgi:type II secretory pathway component PulM